MPLIKEVPDAKRQEDMENNEARRKFRRKNEKNWKNCEEVIDLDGNRTIGTA